MKKWSVKLMLHDMNGLHFYNDQTCPTGCKSIGSSVHGIFQARLLGWGAIPHSREPSQPRDWTHTFFISCTGRLILCHRCWNRKPGSVRGAKEGTPQSSKHSPGKVYFKRYRSKALSIDTDAAGQRVVVKSPKNVGITTALYIY